MHTFALPNLNFGAFFISRTVLYLETSVLLESIPNSINPKDLYKVFTEIGSVGITEFGLDSKRTDISK